MGKDAPPAPDYRGAAQEQAASSERLTNQQTWANRPNITTPWGSQTWSYNPSTTGGTSGGFDQAGYDAAMARYNSQGGGERTWVQPGGGGDQDIPGYWSDGGNPQTTAPTRDQFTTSGTAGQAGPGTWSTSINLSPEQQAALSAQMRIQTGRSNAAETLLGQATSAFQTPMDYGALPQGADRISNAGQGIQSQIGQQGMDDWRQRGQSAVERLMAPQLQARRSAMDAKLANMGITMGSDAWRQAQMQAGDDETRAGLQAISAGRDEAGQIFNQNLQSGQFANAAQNQGFNQGLSAGQFNNQNRQQAIAEALQRRGQPLNELNALLTQQQVSMPQMPSFNPAGVSQAPQYMQAAQNQYQADLNATNASNAGTAGLMNGLFSLGGAAMGMPTGSMSSLFNLSDMRLKTHIKLLARMPNGIGIYRYRYLGEQQEDIGVLAQEVARIKPEAVAPGPDGWMRVNYGALA